MDQTQLRQVAAEMIRLGNALMELADSMSPPSAPPPAAVTLDCLYLARAIQGEGAAMFGPKRDELGLWIGHTAMNRLERGWWNYKTLVDVVSEAFHGYVNVAQPATWALELAARCIDRDEDIAGGALFMLSGEDIKRLGFSSRSAIKQFDHNGLHMYFFKLWPDGKAN